MRPTFSEFSYGFALVNEVLNWRGQNITAVPIYPSLIEEAALGYDVMLEESGVPIFMQFKICDCMVRNSAWEVTEGLLATPFFRMHLYSRGESNQHQRLLDLEANGSEVFYAAPEFYRQEVFNRAFLQREVIDRTWFFRPSSIGPLPDDSAHRVAFKAGDDYGWFCSNPVRIKCDFKGHEVGEYLESQLPKQSEEPAMKDLISGLCERLLDQLSKEKAASGRALHNIRKRRGMLNRLAYISQAFYGAQLFMVHAKPN